MGIRIKGKLLLVLILFLTMGEGISYAQNVTISPSTGYLIAAVTSSDEVGFGKGWSSMWQHYQLPLTLTVSDESTLTSGDLKIPAGNISLYDKNYVWGGGGVKNSGSQTTPSHLCISLPKGYRFTGYKIIVANNLNGQTINGLKLSTKVRKILYETTSEFNTYYTFAHNTKDESNYTMSNNDEKDNEYVIQRTSHSDDDMNNHLYFLLNPYYPTDYYAVTIKSIELYFTATGDCDADLTPTETTSKAVSYLKMPFTTGKLDIGAITKDTKTGYYSYNYLSVKDLKANALLYQYDAITGDKTAADVATEKNIQAITDNSNYYCALGNDTYFLESPTTATTKNGNELQLGYRIVGAKIKYKAQETSYIDSYYITFQKLEWFGLNTYYLGTDGKFSKTPTKWNIDANGKIYSGNTYLTYKYIKYVGYLYTTQTAEEAGELYADDNGIYFTKNIGGSWNYYYLNSNGKFTYPSDVNVSWTANTVSGTEKYTLNIYGTDGKTPIKTISDVTNTDEATYELENLNNDAIKIEVSGLADGAKALVNFELELQALNPYINSLNLVCTNPETNETMTQSFSTNDFAVRGGKFTFYAPESWKDKACKFTFENLYSSYGDNTYYDGKGAGNSRYGFVNSNYYAGEKNLYELSSDASYIDKVSVAVAGNKDFKFNNADELGNTSGQTEEKYLEEYPFSLKAYENAGGAFENFSLNSGKSGTCYLFTYDETRYNIAPTTATQHRSYASYIMDVTMDTKDYTAKGTLSKLYENTYYTDKSGNAGTNKAQYGLTMSTKEANKDDPGYLTATQIYNYVKSGNLTYNGTSVSADQILYIDASNLSSVPFTKGSTDLDKTLALLGSNALIYLPKGNMYAANNFAYKNNTSDGFRAYKNIVLTDKAPFYAPYSIDLEATSFAYYKRAITSARNGKATVATIILPFSINLTADGLHTNDDKSSFYLKSMKEGEFNEKKDNNGITNYTATYDPVEGSTKANVPYVVKVEVAPEDDDCSFIVKQEGATIEQTPTTETNILSGNITTESIKGTRYNFYNYGTYSGEEIPKEDNIFYYAKEQFLNSQYLTNANVNVNPFRTYYRTEDANGSGIAAKWLSCFNLSFDDEEASTTGITSTGSQPDMMIETGIGTITVSVTTSQPVHIYNLSGMSIANEMLQAGESKTYNVPAAVYIVNKTKLIVK